MGCLTHPAAHRLRQTASAGSAGRREPGGPSARSSRRRSSRIAGVDASSAIWGWAAMASSRSSTATLSVREQGEGEVEQHGDLSGRSCHRGLEHLDRFVQAAEAIEAPSPELEAARTIGERFCGICGHVAIEALGLAHARTV